MKKVALPTKQPVKPSWEEFTRFHGGGPDGFFGCVDPEGNWFDSSLMFETAIHWCVMWSGAEDRWEMSSEAEREWMEIEGKRLGYSIIHSSLLQKMYEAGLIK